jgi:hypothetical protein
MKNAGPRLNGDPMVKVYKLSRVLKEI